ncbi:hypothetical protein POM88_015675 [Heracleum sosnowskyi]|uniref:Uncharacterized protein n=1 Tax=Heracleum sosnowskyi TaxID=360622 RepID=A0AAD8MWM2_9APIA|nr:hypothetical protein POM88_015675 [Heracleum sosnowskyi]
MTTTDKGDKEMKSENGYSDQNKQGKKKNLGNFNCEIVSVEEDDQPLCDDQGMMEEQQEEAEMVPDENLEGNSEIFTEALTRNEEIHEPVVVEIPTEQQHEERRSTRRSSIPEKFKDFVYKIPGKEGSTNMVKKMGLNEMDALLSVVAPVKVNSRSYCLWTLPIDCINPAEYLHFKPHHLLSLYIKATP